MVGVSLHISVVVHLLPQCLGKALDLLNQFLQVDVEPQVHVAPGMYDLAGALEGDQLLGCTGADDLFGRVGNHCCQEDDE
jgi:hypothetical protein